jgi:hypothetical protein
MSRWLDRRKSLFVACALSGVVGGCSGEAPADRENENRTEAASAVAGCDLLTTEEIGAALGLAAERSNEQEGLMRGCDWSTSDGRPLVGVGVGAAPRTYDDYMEAVREQMGAEIDKLGMSRVDGVGDYAVWHEAGYLNAAHKGELLVVWVYQEPTNGASKRAAATELGRAAVSRL